MQGRKVLGSVVRHDSELRCIEAGGTDVRQRRAEHGGIRLLFGEPGQADGSKLALKQAHGRTLLSTSTRTGHGSIDRFGPHHAAV